jgi:hypothetical protein
MSLALAAPVTVETMAMAVSPRKSPGFAVLAANTCEPGAVGKTAIAAATPATASNRPLFLPLEFDICKPTSVRQG